MRKRLLAYSLMGLVVIGAAFAQDAVTPEPDVADTFIGGALTAPPADDGNPSILELLRRGGALMYPLYLASFIMAAFGIEHRQTDKIARYPYQYNQ